MQERGHGEGFEVAIRFLKSEPKAGNQPVKNRLSVQKEFVNAKKEKRSSGYWKAPRSKSGAGARLEVIDVDGGR